MLSSAEPDKLSTFTTWCSRQGIWIDARINIVAHRREGPPTASIVEDVAVHSTFHEAIPPGTTLVKIPKDSVLSTRNCSFAASFPFGLVGQEAQLALALALYLEILKGSASRWFGYIQSLPGAVALPIFWGTNFWGLLPQDGREAMLWLHGTQWDRMRSHNTSPGASITSIETIHNYYHSSFAQNLLSVSKDSGVPSLPSEEGFYLAFALVSSRAFLVDAYHGLAMVPVADAFNHVVDNHVHLESEYGVCPECGSLKECMHDSSDVGVHTLGVPVTDGISTYSEDRDDSDTYDMVSTTLIPPGMEIFNTYGQDLTNAQLLSQYGFILEANENDHLDWSVREILDVLSPARPTQRSPDGWFDQGHQLDPALLSASSLVFLNSGSPQMEYTVNSEAKVSNDLWVFLFTLACSRAGSSASIEQVFQDQLTLEGCEPANEDSQESASHDAFGSIGETSRRVLHDIATSMVTLCRTRRRNTGRRGYKNEGLLEKLDELPQEHNLTRIAMSLVIAEWSILDSCESGWEELLEALGSISISPKHDTP